MTAAEGSIIRVDMSVGGWAAVPLAVVNNDTLTLAARGLLLWFLTRPPGWVIRVEHCKAKFSLGEHAWATITQQLQVEGYYHRSKHRDTLGRLTTQVTITPTPGYPGPDEPGPGSPEGRVTPGHKLYEKKIKKEQQQPRAQRAQVVVFSPDLFERGLLSKEEQEQVHGVALEQRSTDAQELADELAGALRARGRAGPRGIKNPVLFLKALGQSGSLTYAPGERALREARARVSDQAKAAAPQHQGAPMPAATRELMERLRRESRGARK